MKTKLFEGTILEDIEKVTNQFVASLGDTKFCSVKLNTISHNGKLLYTMTIVYEKLDLSALEDNF